MLFAIAGTAAYTRGSSFTFFFSSRRRHTRYWRDWSSDVCSSDLADLRDAEAHEHDREEDDGEHQVVEGPGEHDDDPLPPGLLVEHPVAVARQDVVERLAADLGDEAAHAGRALALALLGRRDHADDADVAAQ